MLNFRQQYTAWNRSDISRKTTLELCFLTTCFDVNCLCVDAKKDTRTSLNTTTDKTNGLRTGDKSLQCMIHNEAKNELQKQNVTQKRGMLFRLYNGMICNGIGVSQQLFNECLNKISEHIINSIEVLICIVSFTLYSVSSLLFWYII